ncbi:sensor histidine kinase [Spirosoma rigui]|uniref:sensor histidine kinase n=1 Tax=Spirosoma rigui TaxID=564064 RepID=UPI001FEB47DE|nr:histidine kinase [Spirosoma rigui]
MTTLNDKWLRIVGIAMLLAFSITGNGFHEQPLTGEVLIRILISFVSITVTWHVIRALIFYFRQRYNAKQQLVKRLLLTFVTGSIASTLIIWITGALRHLALYGTLADYRTGSPVASITINKMTLSLNIYGFDFVQATTNFIFFQIIYEALFFARDSSLYQKQLKQAEQEQEKLRTANLQSQLDALKQQVNPHFLFNSLNVLDSLIDDDPRQAREFLSELSTVYRYLLRSNDQHLTDLGTELDFIHSYFHLLRTRHGSALSLNICVDEQYQRYLLPPLTLQLLVENAVKHNIVLPEQPLAIDIVTDADACLLVRNNVQRKSIRVASNGIGLTNILAKYQVLNQPKPMILEDNGQFIVSLPLIETAD